MLAHQEIAWHKALRHRRLGEGLVAQLKGYQQLESRIEIRTELIVGVSLRDVMLDPRLLRLIDGRRIIDAFDRFLYDLSSELHAAVSGIEVDQGLFGDFYRSKVATRADALYERLGIGHAAIMSQASEVGIDGCDEVSPSPEVLVRQLEKQPRWPRMISPSIPTVIHGDLHFGNLVLTSDPGAADLRIRLVDGKSQPFPGMPAAVGDPAYDFGKLLQSIISRVDALIAQPGNGFTTQQLPLWGVECADSNSLYDAMATRVDRELWDKEDRYGPGFRERAHLLHALHMITMPGAKANLPRSSAIKMYATGVMLLQGPHPGRDEKQ